MIYLLRVNLKIILFLLSSSIFLWLKLQESLGRIQSYYIYALRISIWVWNKHFCQQVDLFDFSTMVLTNTAIPKCCVTTQVCWDRSRFQSWIKDTRSNTIPTYPIFPTYGSRLNIQQIWSVLIRCDFGLLRTTSW